jgi:hypothetical protein
VWVCVCVCVCVHPAFILPNNIHGDYFKNVLIVRISKVLLSKILIFFFQILKTLWYINLHFKIIQFEIFESGL